MNSIVNDISLSIDFNEAKRAELLEKLKYDNVTRIHCINVANICTDFIKHTHCDIDNETAFYAGMFHDIGKIKIDKNILNKNGTLTENEFTQMKKHVSYGHNLLIHTALPIEIAISAQYHHEKFDGTGYPLGLKGESIPLISRIISICDVYDALTSNRPYRKAFSCNEALEIMRTQKNHFDPELFSIFLSNAIKFSKKDA